MKYFPLFFLITSLTIPVDAAVLNKNDMPSGEFNLTLNYTSETMANVSGGLKRGTIISGLGHLMLDYATQESSGDHSRFSLRASGILLHGESPSEKYIGDDLTASNIDGYDSFRLYELWFQHSFWNGWGSLRFGSSIPAMLLNFHCSITNYT